MKQEINLNFLIMRVQENSLQIIKGMKHAETVINFANTIDKHRTVLRNAEIKINMKSKNILIRNHFIRRQI